MLVSWLTVCFHVAGNSEGSIIDRGYFWLWTYLLKGFVLSPFRIAYIEQLQNTKCDFLMKYLQLNSFCSVIVHECCPAAELKELDGKLSAFRPIYCLCEQY